MKKYILVKYLLHLCVTCCMLKCSKSLTWNQFMESALWGTGEISTLLEPYVVENFPTVNVSKQCKSSLIAYAEGLRNFEPWAVKMFDATGKPPSTILRHTYADFGSFDKCLTLEVNASSFFKGRFCMLTLKTPLLPIQMGRGEKESYIKTRGYPPEWAEKITKIFWQDWGEHVALYLGLCIPSACTESDLNHIISAYVEPAELHVSLTDCQLNEPRKWATIETFAIICTSCLLMAIIAGTVLDIIERKIKQKNDLCLNKGEKPNILKVFSLVSNMEKLFETKMTDKSMEFIHGMKFWIVVWVVTLHTSAYETLWIHKRSRIMTNYGKAKQFYWILYLNGLINTSYFVFLNGFLSTYSLRNKLSSPKSSKGKNGIFKLVLIKYCRAVPSIVFLMLMAFVIPVTLNGPTWNSTWGHLQDKCLKNGWANLLFVSDFVTFNNHCYIHMWVISALMQYYIISLPLLFIAKRRPKLAVLLGALISIGCGVRDFRVSIENEFILPAIPTMGSLKIFQEFTRDIYFRPYNHFSTFGIGMIFGWINLKNFKMNKRSLSICWVIYVLFSLLLFYIVQFPTQNLIFTAFHNAFRGVFVGLQMGWLVYTCSNGAAGIVGRIFAWKALVPFSKILNAVTMYHPLLVVTYEALRRERFFITLQSFVTISLPLLVYSFLFGAVVYLMVDLPFSRLCDIWEGKRATAQHEKSDGHSNAKASQNKEKKDV